MSPRSAFTANKRAPKSSDCSRLATCNAGVAFLQRKQLQLQSFRTSLNMMVAQVIRIPPNHPTIFINQPIFLELWLEKPPACALATGRRPCLSGEAMAQIFHALQPQFQATHLLRQNAKVVHQQILRTRGTCGTAPGVNIDSFRNQQLIWILYMDLDR